MELDFLLGPKFVDIIIGFMLMSSGSIFDKIIDQMASVVLFELAVFVSSMIFYFNLIGHLISNANKE